MTKTLLLLALWACDAKPVAKVHPSATSSDPWATAPSTTLAPPPTPTEPAAATGLPDGEWKCSMVNAVRMNGYNYTQTSGMNGFTLHGTAFSSDKEGSGTVEIEGSYATFHGGGFDNWRGAFTHHKDGSLYLAFGGASHRDAQPDHGEYIGDVLCVPP